MLDWDVRWLQLVEDSDLELEEKARYMDDLRAWLFTVRLGWRWMEGELVYCQEWRKEELKKGMTGLQKTVEVLQAMMTGIHHFLHKPETEDDFEDPVYTRS